MTVVPYRVRTQNDDVYGNPTVLSWLADHDCEVNHVLPPAYMQTPEAYAPVIALAQVFDDYGIPLPKYQ